MPRPRSIAACDAETDPFLHGRVPFPFVWGYFDGRQFIHFKTTREFVDYVKDKRIILFAHNGGKFDFMYLLLDLGETKAQIINGRIVSMFLGACELRDSYSIIPEKLENFGDKEKIEYWKMEKNVRDQHEPEIIHYLEKDCVSLYNGVTTYFEIAGKNKTIASNALSFAKSLGLDPGRTNYHHDNKYRRFFFGGRTEVFRAGTHKNISILDIRSAYPFAMLHEHATGIDFERGNNIGSLTREEIQRSFIVLKCFSKGAFPKRVIGPEGGLSFPIAFDEYNVTGWEYLVALEFGLISDIEIVSVRTAQKTINFRAYVEHWYDLKRANPKSKSKIMYTIAKIMMNSLYGKTAQDPSRYYDYKIMPAGTRCCSEFVASPARASLPSGASQGSHVPSDICAACGQKDREHGWMISTEFEGKEIHRRESLWKYRFDYGEDWEGKDLYHNVATGASITGFTRAHLLRAIHTIGLPHLIYCDTDSLIVDTEADLTRLPISENLGDWQIEDTGAPIGHFAGKKLYGIKLSPDGAKREQTPYKIASKGSKLAFEDLERIINGETIEWRNEAPTFSITSGRTPFPKKGAIISDPNDCAGNLFVVRKIRATGLRQTTTPGTLENLKRG